MGEFSPFHWLVVLIIIGPLYFLPAIIGRKKKNAPAIVALNFFLGWTFVGWIVALVWAFTNDPVPTQVIVNQPAPVSVLCSNCGKYSPPGTKFCSMCGAQMTT
jgi:RsiW-degrading membrane proteinase PrsW (M82 family)